MNDTKPTPEETSSGNFVSELTQFCEKFTNERLTRGAIAAICTKCRDLMAKYGQPRTIWVGYSFESGRVDIVDRYEGLDLLYLSDVKRVDSPIKNTRETGNNGHG